MIHNDDTIKAYFTEYRERLNDLERQKAILDTEIGCKLEGISQDGKIQCEIVEDAENGGVMVSYYRIDPLNTAKPDVEPEAAKSVWYDGRLYYKPEELAEIEQAVEEDDGLEDIDESLIKEKLAEQEGVIEPSIQPEGPPPAYPPGAGGPTGPGVASNN